MQTNMLLHACGNGNAAEKPKANPSATRRLPNGHAPQNAVSHERTPAIRARKINLMRASIHKTARNPIIVKDNAVRREARGLPRGRTRRNKEGSPPYKRGAPDCLYEENR